MRLPLQCRRTPDQTAVNCAQVTQQPARGRKCLIVDADPEATLAALEAQLRTPDREIFTGHHGTAKPWSFRENTTSPSYCSTCRFPTLDGQTLAELMRGAERSSATPIMFMTSAGPERAACREFRGFEAAAVDVLFKPVNAGILRQKAKLFVELYRQKQELARAVRAREDVLAIVSHDMRTPLSVVHTTASMLLNPKYQLTPQQVREQHERIRRNVDLMNRMIGDLHGHGQPARRASCRSIPGPWSINDVLREAVAAHEAAARDKGITLRYDAGNDDCRPRRIARDSCSCSRT